MARLDFTFVPTAAAAGGNAGLTLEDIPQDIKDDIEEVYAYLKTNPAGRMRTPAFVDSNGNPSKQNALAWQAMATAYCRLRPAGEIRFRKSPTKGLPDHIFDFRVTDLVDNGTNGIRDAVEAAKASAQTVQAPSKGTKK